MATESTMTETDAVTLFSQGLLSKWGFGDGDVLDDAAFDWCQANGAEYGTANDHAVLIRLVREHLLPALDQSVEVYEITTIHNPIRARSVDGVAVSDDVICGDELGPRLTPEWVSVPLAVVHKAFEEQWK